VSPAAAPVIEVLDAFAFDAAVRPAMRHVIEWCGELGIPFLLVSASPEAIVREAARRLRLDEHGVIAMRPAMRGGVVLPELSATPTYGPGKVTRLTEHLGDAPLLAAFGDNTWDAAMLERAAFPVMVAPKPGLRERMVGVDGVFDMEAP
jgi:phosphoserine phosphatase